MRALLDSLIAVLFAPQCGVCAAPLLRPTLGCVCDDCWRAVIRTPSPRCVRCGDHVANDMNGTIRVCHDCMRASSAIACATAIGPHVETLRSIVHALKYDGRRSIARPLAAMMRAEGAALIARCEVAVPVPLHAARRRSRGFNQAEDLALHVGLPVVRALTRIRHTDTQTALPAAERHQNVAGAFRPTRRAARVRGRSVLLIDDVRTTGATLEECALTLRGVGAGEVCALTAARVAPPDR